MVETALTSLLGIDPDAGFRLARWLFLRALGLVYVTAFVSLWVQVRGLVGERGILPADDFLDGVRRSREGPDLLRVPTLFWVRSDDVALHLGCAAGVVLGLLLTVGVAPALCLVLLWALYLSFAAVGRVFLSFQWDVLLLEAGFTGILLAPWRILPGESAAAVPTAALALMWWLLFRLHVQSGLGKLQSGDRTWRDLTALYYHFCTQPLPNPVAWFAHRLPAAAHRAAVWTVGPALGLTSAGVLWRQHVPAIRLPPALTRLLEVARPFRTVNGYGLFRVMTTERPEIVVEGSRDGRRWKPYEFRYKPGDRSRPPPWVAPHQPRLDWQMWFAALGSWKQNRWFRAFLIRLLEGVDPVVDLLESTPFDEAPRYVRAVLYEYRFTTRRERRETGRWWRRERLGPYGPVVERSEVVEGT